MKLRFFIWLIIVTALMPSHRAASQATPVQETLFAYNPATGRVVIFQPEAGTPNILLDDSIGEGKRLREAWRIGPNDFLLLTHDEDRLNYWTYWLSATDGLHDVSALFDWGGWTSDPDPVFFVQGRLVMLARENDPLPSLYIMDFQTKRVQTFPAVDYIGPRLAADKTKLRFVGLLPDTTDKWEVMEYDFASGQVTPLNLIHIKNPDYPLINTDQYGEHWLRRIDKTSPPDLIGLDGSIRTVDPPLTPTMMILSFNLRHDRILTYDLSCRTDCMAYVQPMLGGDWVAYPMPNLRSAIVYGLVGDRVVVMDGDQKIYISEPDGTLQLLGYLSGDGSRSIFVSDTWSPDLQYLVFGDDPLVPTTIHLYSVEAEQILLSQKTDFASVAVTYTVGGIVLDVEGHYWCIRHTDGQTFEFIAPPADLAFPVPQLLADGSVIFSVRNRDDSLFQVRRFDPRTATESSILLDGVMLRSVSPMLRP